LSSIADFGVAFGMVGFQKGFSFKTSGFGGGCFYGDGHLGHVSGMFFVMGPMGNSKASLRSQDKQEKEKCLACHLYFARSDGFACSLLQNPWFDSVAAHSDASSIDPLHVFFCFL
jgi:hypothetical protein